MSGKIISAVAAAILLASTGLASAAGAGGPSAVAGGYSGVPYEPSPGYAQSGSLYNSAPGLYGYAPGNFRSGSHMRGYYDHAPGRWPNAGGW